jgi:hypothetical protein
VTHVSDEPSTFTVVVVVVSASLLTVVQVVAPVAMFVLHVVVVFSGVVFESVVDVVCGGP